MRGRIPIEPDLVFSGENQVTLNQADKESVMNRIAWPMLIVTLVALSVSACAVSSDCAPVAQNGGPAVCAPPVANYGDYDPNLHGNYPD